MRACDVRNLGPMVLMWKKGHRVLTAGSVVVKRDKRIELNGTNVKITGNYCFDFFENNQRFNYSEPNNTELIKLNIA